jgi:cyclic-di-GMP phosphodiesterase TipF (flagellum assembly factor)
LDKSGIDLIVTHIETEKELVELLDLGIDYGQGYLFSEPENPKNL